MNAPKIIAIFDFDGTITHKSTTLSFLRYVLGYKYYLKLIILTPVLLLYIFKIFNIDQLNYYLCRICLKKYHQKELLEKSNLFVHAKLNKFVKAGALKKIREHKSKGHFCILATSAYDVYIKEWGKVHNFDEIVCTKLEFDSHGYATGKICGKSCNGKEKLTQILRVIGNEEVVTHAYGDSVGDKEMLAFANYPYYRVFK